MIGCEGAESRSRRSGRTYGSIPEYTALLNGLEGEKAVGKKYRRRHSMARQGLVARPKRRYRTKSDQT